MYRVGAGEGNLGLGAAETSQDGDEEQGPQEDEATVRQRVLMSDPNAQSKDTLAEYTRYIEYLKAVIESRDGDLIAMHKRLKMLTNLVFMLAADASPSGERLVGYLSVLLT
jgi:hypothetical protein